MSRPSAAERAPHCERLDLTNFSIPSVNTPRTISTASKPPPRAARDHAVLSRGRQGAHARSSGPLFIRQPLRVGAVSKRVPPSRPGSVQAGRAADSRPSQAAAVRGCGQQAHASMSPATGRAGRAADSWPSQAAAECGSGQQAHGTMSSRVRTRRGSRSDAGGDLCTAPRPAGGRALLVTMLKRERRPRRFIWRPLPLPLIPSSRIYPSVSPRTPSNAWPFRNSRSNGAACAACASSTRSTAGEPSARRPWDTAASGT